MNVCRNKLKERKRKWKEVAKSGGDEDKKRERWGGRRWRRRRRTREYIPTNRETCARVFSYVRCVVASRRFRISYCEASRCDTTRRIVSFARSFWRTRVIYSRIEQLNDWLSFLLFLFFSLGSPTAFDAWKKIVRMKSRAGIQTRIESTIY